MMQGKDPARKPHIDVAKGIAMMLVLAGHIKSCPEQLHSWLYSFHMPLFFVLSGITLRIRKETGFREYLNKRIHRLIIPYFLLSGILWILTKPLEYLRGADEESLIRSFIGIFAGHRLSEYYFSMWFIPVLFISEMVLFLLLRKLYVMNGKKKAAYTAGIALLFLLAGAYTVQRFYGLPWSLDLVPFGIAFVALGVLLQPLFGIEAKLSARKSSLLVIACCSLAINIACCRENLKYGGAVDLYYCRIYNAAYFAAAAISGTVFVLCISMLINRNAVLEYTGKNTLTFYAFNNSFAIPYGTALITALFSGIEANDSRIFIPVFVVSYLILAAMTQPIYRYMPAAAGIKRPDRHYKS